MAEDIFNSKWKDFCTHLYREIINLKSTLERNNIEIKKNQRKLEIIKTSKLDIEFMLKYKNFFINIDNSLENVFSALEQFKIKNGLNNSALPGLCEKQIFNSPMILQIIRDIEEENNELSKENKKLTDRISKLEDLRDGVVFSQELIRELIQKFQLDNMTGRIILLYPIRKLAKVEQQKINLKIQDKVEDKISSKEQEETKEPEVEGEEEQTAQNDEPQRISNNIRNQQPLFEIEYEEETDFQNVYSNRKNRILSQYRQLSTDFKKLRDRYEFILSKYELILNDISKSELSIYQIECDEIERNYSNISTYETRIDYEHKKSILLAYQMLMKKINITRILNKDYSKINAADIDALTIEIENYDELGKELTRIDSQLEYYQNEADINESTTREQLESLPTETKESKTNDNSQNIEYYKSQKSRYEGLKEKIKELINKYLELINNMKPYEKQYYSYYVSLPENELESIDKSEYLISYEDAQSKILAFKLFDLMQEIENTFKEIKSKNYSDTNDLEYVKESISEFQSISDKLRNIDSKLTGKTTENIETSNVYFVLDENGDLLSSNEEIYSELLGVSLENFLKKKVVRNAQNLKELFGKKVYVKRTSNNVISFIKTGIENTQSYGILILCATSIKNDGVTKIETETKKIASKYGSLIASQIALIEERNPEYLKTQEEIRKKLTPTSRVGGLL